jgi:hypothetical protein
MLDKILLLAALSTQALSLWPANVTEYTFNVQLDHFSNHGKSEEFPIRYLVQTKYWDFQNGPILFYTGNEGDIYSFYNNTGFWTYDLAKELNALVVFGEHRYFGESFPTQFDKKTAFNSTNVSYMSVEQVMMDYVQLIKHVKYTYKADGSPVIAFGGSYGGMLSGWMRMHFPHVIAGAVAASAPILYFEAVTSPEKFFVTNTNTFKETNPNDYCNKIVRESWDHIMTVKDNLSIQAAELKTQLNLCTEPKTADDVEDVYLHFASGLQYMTMTDYPTESDFLEPMPANPVNVSCAILAKIPLPTTADFVSEKALKAHRGASNAAVAMTDRAKLVLTGLKNAANIYFNYQADPVKCANWDDTDASGGNLGAGDGWNALACNELDMPQGSNGVDDMFLNRPYVKKTDMGKLAYRFLIFM